MNSLRFQLIGWILLPLTLLAAIVVWTTFNAVEGLVERRLEKEIELVARAIRMPVQQAYADGDLDRVAQSLDAVFEIGRVYGAYVYDAAGRRVVIAGDARPGPREQIQAAELVELGQELGEYAQLGGEDVYSYFVPLTGTTGRIIGLLQVVRQESDIARQLLEIRQRGWWVWGGVVLLMILVVLFGHRYAVSRHVRSVLDSMARVEAGQRQHRAAIGGPAELAAIGAGLNRMLDAIADMERRLDRQNQAHLAMTERLREQENLAALGRFSSGVAHELGAPLTVIDGDARRLEQNEALGTDARRRVARMRAQVDRTRRLVSQLMEFVRSDQREASRIPVTRLFEQVLSGIGPECDARALSIRVVSPTAGLHVSGHEIRLEHALLNLVRNALQSASSIVHLKAGRDQTGRIEISVEDDGPGVPQELGDQIFEPFHCRREDGRGTGLGLAIVRSVAEEHRAEIRVDRSPDLHGARFTLCFEQRS